MLFFLFVGGEQSEAKNGSFAEPALKVASAFTDNEINGGDTVSNGWLVPTINLIPAFEVDLASFSVVFCLFRKLPQLPACLPLITAALSQPILPLCLSCSQGCASNLATKPLAFPTSHFGTNVVLCYA